MWHSVILHYVRSGILELLEKARCGDGYLSTVPTFLWTFGSAALANKLISTMFRRFMFRRVPLWETVLQHLLFIWIIIYSLHFWVFFTNIAKFLIKYCYETDDGLILIDDEETCKILQQCLVWMCSTIPLIVYIQTRPKVETPPLMIWITSNPWHRREMGAYGYYLNRPISELQTTTNMSECQPLSLRRAYSDPRTVVRETPKKRRNSKSV